MLNTDVAIVGAGPAGLALSLFLARRGCQVTLLERQDTETLAAPADDGREIALTHKSERLLRELGAWELLSADEIGLLEAAQVVDGHSPYCLSFDDNRHGPLGCIVSNASIRRVLYQQVQQNKNIQLIDRVIVTELAAAGGERVLQYVAHGSLQKDGSQKSGLEKNGSEKNSPGGRLSAALVVAADSRFSDTRKRAGIGADMCDFGRSAIVGRVRTEQVHGGIARECFRYGSTLALLPLADPYISSAVVTIPSSRALELVQCSDEEFAAHVDIQSQKALGKSHCVGERHCYPLVATYAHRFYAERFALVGDAAVGMHPVTAHGFNLGIAGANTLAKQIRSADRLRDSGKIKRALIRYQWLHRLESRPIYTGTNKVVGLFTDERPPLKLLRKAVLRVSSHLPPIRKAIVHQLTR